MKKLLALAFPLTLLASAPSQAAPIYVTFSLGPGGSGATGSMVYEADSATSPILSITSFDMTLYFGSPSFTLADVGFINTGPGTARIGGTLNGVGEPLPDTNDFYFDYQLGEGVYASWGQWTEVGDSIIWNFAPVLTTRLGPAAVPEPASLALLGAMAVAGVAARRVSRRKS
ncbi:MAG: PEP-CTERM sorting domain-containing protein [Burkholderiales bacterium]|nr:PEP-CTERM sorting domain-containing protein [Burkholderiales bacterium]